MTRNLRLGFRKCDPMTICYVTAGNLASWLLLPSVFLSVKWASFSEGCCENLAT